MQLSLRLLLLAGWGILSVVNNGSAAPTVAEVEALDAFGVERVLNPAQGVAVVVYSNPGVQDRTREAGLLLHQFVGQPGFQFMVLVDLRKTMADWAPGYTQRRIQRDLLEKFKALPVIPGRDLEKIGRPDVSAIADFKGEACVQLGWMEPADALRVIIFLNGKEFKRWDDLTQLSELPAGVQQALAPSTQINSSK